MIDRLSMMRPSHGGQVQLPLWPDHVRAVPNGFLRSALFGVVAKGNRRFVKTERVAALDGIEIKYTGERLDQSDLDVWETVLHITRVQALGKHCRVTSYRLLKLMGKTDSGKNRETLHARITRLRAGAIEIKQGRYIFIGGLLDEARKDEVTQEWLITVNPRLRDLYSPDQFTMVDWAVRNALDGHQLAQWLHGFYASHARPFPIKVETLHMLCGSEAGLISDFKKKLRKALDAVAETSNAHFSQFKYELKGELLHVSRKPSKTQYLHLVRRGKAR